MLTPFRWSMPVSAKGCSRPVSGLTNARRNSGEEPPYGTDAAGRFPPAGSIIVKLGWQVAAHHWGGLGETITFQVESVETGFPTLGKALRGFLRLRRRLASNSEKSSGLILLR